MPGARQTPDEPSKNKGGRPKKAPRRGHREGSVRQVGPNRWKGSISLGKLPDGSYDRRYVSGPTKEDVLDQLAKLRSGRRKGTLPAREAQGQTVGMLLWRWHAGRRGTVEEATWRDKERHIALHLEPALGHLKLHELTRDHLSALYSQLQAPPRSLSPKYVREIHGTLRQAFDQAEEDGLLERNITRRVKLPKLERRTVQYILHPDQLARFWRVAATDRLYALWQLAAHFPSRSGELRGARWSDLDEQHGTLTIQRNLLRSWDAGRQLQTKNPKTQAGGRTIELDAPLLEILRAHRARQVEDRRKAGKEWVSHDLIFCSRYGTPLRSENVLRQFRRLLERAALPRHYRVHDLRHTSVSSMLAAGVPLAEVSELAGHANKQITALLYAHVVRRGRSTALSQVRSFYEQDGAAEADPFEPLPAGPQKALTPQQESEIRRDYLAGGVTQKQLAQRYSVSPSTINLALRGVRNKDAKDTNGEALPLQNEQAE